MPLILWTVTAVLLASSLGAPKAAAAQENSTSKERPVTVPPRGKTNGNARDDDGSRFWPGHVFF